MVFQFLADTFDSKPAKVLVLFDWTECSDTEFFLQFRKETVPEKWPQRAYEGH